MEFRIRSAWPSSVGAPALNSKPPAAEEAAIGAGWGGAGRFPPVDAGRARAAPATAAPDDAPVELAAVDAVRAPANPAAAPSIPAVPAVKAVTAAPTIAAAVLPTSPLTIRLATNGITAIASE